jgi:hypothetical protein
MTPRTVVLSQAAMALAAVALVTGCSAGKAGSDTASTPNASASASARVGQAWRAVTTCMRSHGYPNFPDAVVDREGNWTWASPPPRRPAPACDNLARTAKSLARPEDKDRVSAADLAKLRQYAVCMRRQGLADWPDPGSRGSFSLPSRLLPPAGEALVRPADRVCTKLLKGAKVTIDAPGSVKK